MFGRLVALARAPFRRAALDREIDDELALHLELRAVDLERQGLSHVEAVRRARIELGNVTSAAERARAAWGTEWIDRLSQDVRYAVRGMGRQPMFSAVAVLSLAFGIGATTTVYSVIDALDFRPLPFHDPDRLVWLGEVTPRGYDMCSRCAWWTASPTLLDWKAQSESFAGVAAAEYGEFAWQHDDVSEPLSAQSVTPGFFELLGSRTILGRGFAASDAAPGAEPAIVVSYEFWQKRLHGDPQVVGRRLAAPPGQPGATIIGVLPHAFRFEGETPVWLPLSLDAGAHRTTRPLRVIARLRPAASVESADAELKTISNRLAAAFPADYRGWGAQVQPLRSLLTTGTGHARFILFAITTLVLIIAVLNVAGLLIARGVAREHELAMRSALGAGRGRLFAQLLVEGSCVGLIGGALGVSIAAWAIRLIPAWLAISGTGIAVHMDARILAFALVVSIAAGLGTAIAPARRAAATNAGGSALISGRQRPWQAGRAPRWLVTLQIALALIVSCVASLLSRDFMEMRYLDIGYDPVGLYSTSVLGDGQRPRDPIAWLATAEAARQRVAATPGVAAASLEYENAMHPSIVRPERGTEAEASQTPFVKAVDVDYFTTFGMTFVAGRGFGPEDSRGAPLVAVVNRAAAGAFWPHQNAVGRQVFLGDSGSAGELLTVVGVTRDVERGDLSRRHWAIVYRPMAQARFYHAVSALYVRVAGDSPSSLSAAERAIRETTGRRTAPFASDEETLDGSVGGRRLNAILLDCFAAFGLFLAALGIYGGVGYGATRRTRELGIRMALGARRMSVVGLVARDAFIQSAVGVALGCIGAYWAMGVVRASGLLATPMPVWLLLAAASVVMVVASAATLLPAVRGTRVDIMRSLRNE
ncbi:MAG TPA: ADOP family duplicated permease [Gemmatimonadaceae bacterium]|nr:ADOP family duplicated permease [Gemmatimonadaceae bacterium]